MVRVVAPSRLHFGLFHVPAAGDHRPGERAFGGVGLMIDTPSTIVAAEPADSWRFEGMLASRAQSFAMRFIQAIPEDQRRPFQVLVERCPPEHTGLGVGTQLGLAVGKALSVALGETDVTSQVIAARVGRGERSAIGVHGFDRGGLLVDAGKLPGEEVSPLLAHVSLPKEWRVVVFASPAAGSWHGHVERAAFAAARGGDPNALRRLVDAAIIPAVRAGDFPAFGDAVHEFNRRAGEPFAAAQGGPYASPAVAELIAELRAAGVHGVGQSSWGPTVFAIAPDTDTALSLVLRFGRRVPAMVARVSAGHTV
ncbi:Beta-ribofuranosylaminobenzene 5'-phosphate synthase OS=Gemmata sp. Wa1-1 GN=mptG PE=4 SV=1: GHMP_kinases_C [Gemmataceae bacterium]|nr:Beta-ribofuranosylaminobenzene 5'-phosphate synthase OS=Gemmata sp. Wa1-1 GN=mptG PE=4 SV=1: GHMP_kinases_C [Gemmataceae bacterium]VTT97212.1 Beta-ribofuranosylaminobenzene 5'-phosphate synthase OS=Gemmata sp. Wa1-1 GN=mptG PE=4 SV=1: GHMP_kinases_C [Gemmataceae bacterium]